MNSRIRFDDLQSSPYQELIYSLAEEWVKVAPPADGLIYEDYTHAVAILLLTTQSPDRTATIVKAILQQASQFHKTPAWILQELRFEGMIEGADRIDFLRLDLSQTPMVDDAALDLYNERVNRFSDQE